MVNCARRRFGFPILPIFLIISVALVMPQVQVAQSGERAFDVASIHPNVFVPPGHTVLECSADGRFTSTDSPMLMILYWAYDLPYFRVAGAPDWFDSFQRTYNIEAKASSAITQAECKQMARQLFEERFKLKTHFEDRNVPQFSLIVGRNGHKMREVSASSRPVMINGRTIGSPPGVEPPKGLTMARLVQILNGAPILGGLPVIDRTGLQGLYEMNFEYSAIEGGERPSVFSALSDQLGLRLEESTGPMPVLVIDSVERPSEN
jgi:uncharacterized protein (TIGR03435 family)